MERRLNPSVKVRPLPNPDPSAPPANHRNGKPWIGRLALGIGALLLFASVAYAVLFADHADITPEARIGFIGGIIGYTAGWISAAVAYYFPQND